MRARGVSPGWRSIFVRAPLAGRHKNSLIAITLAIRFRVNLACFQHPSPEVYDQGLLPLRIILEPDELLTVHLRENEVARTLRSEAILDVNHAGRWIRGIELVGGVDFNLARAVKPFKPTRPSMGDQAA
jgi:hypothetical protein